MVLCNVHNKKLFISLLFPAVLKPAAGPSSSRRAAQNRQRHCFLSAGSAEKLPLNVPAPQKKLFFCRMPPFPKLFPTAAAEGEKAALFLRFSGFSAARLPENGRNAE